MAYKHDLGGKTSQQREIINRKDENERIYKEENKRMKETILDDIEFESCKFNITKEGNIYYDTFEEMATYDENLNILRTVKIPQCYNSHMVFKLK